VAEIGAKLLFDYLGEHGSQNTSSLDGRPFGNDYLVTGPAETWADILIQPANADDGRSAYHRIVAILVAGGVAGDDVYSQLLAFPVNRVPDHLQLLFGHVHRQVQIDGKEFRPEAAGNGIGGDDMHGEPSRPFPAVLRHDKDGVAGERHRLAADFRDAHVHTVLRPHQHIIAFCPQSREYQLLENIRGNFTDFRHLVHNFFSFKVY